MFYKWNVKLIEYHFKEHPLMPDNDVPHVGSPLCIELL